MFSIGMHALCQSLSPFVDYRINNVLLQTPDVNKSTSLDVMQ